MMQFPYTVETTRGPATFRTVGAPIVGITQDDVDAAEWLELEAQHVRCPHSGYLIPTPNRVSHGIMYWTGTGCGKGRAHPNAYRLLSKKSPSGGAVKGPFLRATSTAQAALMLAGTSTRYTAPQLGPVERGKSRVLLTYNTKKAAWTR